MSRPVAMLRPSILVLLSGCAGAIAPLAPPAELPARSAGRCEIVGAAPDVALTVDALSYPIELTRPARYTLGEGPEVEVHADSPLDLDAHVALESVPLRLEASVRLFGLLTASGVAAMEPVLDGPELAVTLPIDMDLSVRLPVGCNVLGLGAGTRPSGGVILDATHEVVGDAPLSLAPTPTAPPFASLLTHAGSRFRVVARVGRRARIVRALELGAIDGWVEASRLSPVPSGGAGYAYGSSSCCGGASLFGRGRPSGIAYEGPAVLRRGAAVLGDGDRAFATATEDVHVTVMIRSGSETASLWRIDGITSSGRADLPEGMHARVSDLDLPPGITP